MIKNILLLLLIMVIAVPPIASANQNPSTGYVPTTPTGGPCDFGGFLNALGERESQNNYAIKNSIGFLGRWQFGKGALSDIGWYSGGRWTQEAQAFGINSDQSFLNSPAGQDQAMKEWMDVMARGANIYGLEKYIGKKYPSCPDTPVTWSGILAGRHLCGYGNTRDTSGQCAQGTSLIRYFSSGGTVAGRDGYGTPVSEYVCKFSGFNTPYEHGGKAADCGAVNNLGETGGSVTNPPPPYTGTPGASHPSINVENDQFERQAEILKYFLVARMQQMTSSISAFMMQQVFMIGTFFDAKHQLETQRLLQEKTAEAHKDYHPSVQMCEIGTFIRDLTESEKRSELTKGTLAKDMIDRALGNGKRENFMEGSAQETKKRTFIDKFCSSKDNARNNRGICPNEADANQDNADISYTTTIDLPLTLDVDMTDTLVTPDEENLFAFLDYIFMHQTFPWKSANETVLFNFIQPYQDMRSLIAMRGVAQGTFADIIAKKTRNTLDTTNSAAPFMKSLMRQMGIEDDDIETILGKSPSYYAQMEVLTKKIYQHPEFVSNLYDKPANVKRIRAALTAIKLMQDRDLQDALHQREMLMSIILEMQLREDQKDMINDVINPVRTAPAGNPAYSVYGTGEDNPFGVGTFNPVTGTGGF